MYLWGIYGSNFVFSMVAIVFPPSVALIDQKVL